MEFPKHRTAEVSEAAEAFDVVEHQVSKDFVDRQELDVLEQALKMDLLEYLNTQAVVEIPVVDLVELPLLVQSKHVLFLLVELLQKQLGSLKPTLNRRNIECNTHHRICDPMVVH